MALCFENPVFSSGRRGGLKYRILARFPIFKLKAKRAGLGDFDNVQGRFWLMPVSLCAQKLLFFDILFFFSRAGVGFK